ncbi:peptidase M23 [Pontibacillus chungwhensis BH030062]|uniref:Peptidase M23 n=1 Tax=Pontibacillus chungwhensis BH030062 TaxID=1385513 RepID=A0A0A2VFA3_9BACI|nr:M23 family metallopeptidase [Pontibacillus chungwhensis]KGP92300.1 peptidase M23 [Pontibacillus chungwhensis BH030062]
MSIWLYALVYYILPIALLIRLWKGELKSRLLGALEIGLTFSFFAYLFVVIPWHVYSHYIRFLWVLLFLPVLFIAIKRLKPLPLKRPKGERSGMFSNLLSFAVMIFFTFMAVSGVIGYSPSNDEAIDLAFPLKDGVYATGQGGATTIINYHNEHKPQQYAIDILELNGAGLRANGLTPSELEAFEIYNAFLYSPCSGEVIQAVDQYEDIPPLESPDKVEEAKGNHITLRCQSADVLLAHMKPGSVQVTEGQTVKTGELLGLVGNTGNTTEPHLHIHAERDGVGVPITFDGRFLKRNSLVFQ